MTVRRIAAVAASAAALTGVAVAAAPSAQAETKNIVITRGHHMSTAPSFRSGQETYKAKKGAHYTADCKVRAQNVDGNRIWYKTSVAVAVAPGYVPARYARNTRTIGWCNDGNKAFEKGVTTATLTKREAPGTQERSVGTFRKGATVKLVCKVYSQSVQGNDRWYYTSAGDWISARYVRNVGAVPGYCK